MKNHEMSEAGRKIRDAMRTPLPQAWGLGILGAAMGAVAGWFIYFWLLSQNLYALALPGALVGLGFGFLSKRRMLAGGVFCAIVALGLSIILEWKSFPFIADKSLQYFVTHLTSLKPMTLIFMVLGTLFGFWFGRGR